MTSFEELVMNRYSEKKKSLCLKDAWIAEVKLINDGQKFQRRYKDTEFVSLLLHVLNRVYSSVLQQNTVNSFLKTTFNRRNLIRDLRQTISDQGITEVNFAVSAFDYLTQYRRAFFESVKWLLYLAPKTVHDFNQDHLIRQISYTDDGRLFLKDIGIDNEKEEEQSQDLENKFQLRSFEELNQPGGF